MWWREFWFYKKTKEHKEDFEIFSILKSIVMWVSGITGVLIIGLGSTQVKRNPFRESLNDPAADIAMFILGVSITLFVIFITRQITFKYFIKKKSPAHSYWLGSDCRTALIHLETNAAVRLVLQDLWQILFHMKYLGYDSDSQFEQISKIHNELEKLDHDKPIQNTETLKRIKSLLYHQSNSLGHTMNKQEPNFDTGRSRNPHIPKAPEVPGL